MFGEGLGQAPSESSLDRSDEEEDDDRVPLSQRHRKRSHPSGSEEGVNSAGPVAGGEAVVASAAAASPPRGVHKKLKAGWTLHPTAPNTRLVVGITSFLCYFLNLVLM